MARYVRKEFLSPCAWETGSIICQIETPLVKDISQYQIEKGYATMHASIKLSDCSDSITLDFDCHDQVAYEKRIAKLDKMVKEVQDMRDQYEAMWENTQRNMEHKKRQLAQEAIDKKNAADERARNYRGRV
jgi:predicted phage tail protein